VKKKETKDLSSNFIKFLGTGGARFVVSKQLRASGGIWLSYQGTQVIIDPGPGALVKALSSRPKLDPAKLDGIILTHRHLDHASDVNIMIEAMTKGGFKKKGTLFAPADALDSDRLNCSRRANRINWGQFVFQHLFDTIILWRPMD